MACDANMSPDDFEKSLCFRKDQMHVIAAICGEKYDWKQPNRLRVVQTGESIDQAKVFKAHAVPQGLRAKQINALKLLAIQQEDRDGLFSEHRDKPR